MMKINVLFVALGVSLLAFNVSAQPQTNTQELQKVTKLFDDFLYSWLVEQDIDKAVEYFDNGKLDSNTRKIFSVNSPSFDSNIWLRKVLTMWLFSDHEQVEMYGHGDPNEPDYINLPPNPSSLTNKVNWQSAAEAMKQVFPLTQNNRPNNDLPLGSYVSVFILNNAPSDAVIFVVEKINNEWKITAHLWWVA
ncbi:MAG: hypothetical protein HYX22_01215 [Candidatus Yanofskybacteria bacterium]|nr:hypothetical protein [Candidatus Yanofskybacteria bacterium]